MLTLLVAACGTTVRPSATPLPPASSAPATAVPSSAPFAPVAYPAKGDAPCAEKAAPDERHGAYRGELKRISAPEPDTVVFELCRADVAFLSKIAAPAFAINDRAWLASHIERGDATDQPIVTQANGTGPYRLERWDRGAEVSLARNDAYWGTPARNERLVVRWRDGAAQRLVELQGATVDGIDMLDAAAAASVESDVNLQPGTREGLNTFYIGFTPTFAPFADVRVRRAIALAIDRRPIVERFFPPGSTVATHYSPCTIPNGCAGPDWLEYDPLLAKELLTAAGFPNGFDTTIRYREAPRPYLPDPTGIATEVQAQLLANLGIRATLAVAPEDTFDADLEAGTLDGIHLAGQSVSYPDASGYLDPQFASSSKELGAPSSELAKALATGRSTANQGARLAAYAKANDAIRGDVPLIPVAHAGSAAAFRADVDGAATSPLGLERFASMESGDRRQLVWLTTAEPDGLYCADETDPVSSLVCAQLSDGLYAYENGVAVVTPALARSCNPSAELTVWTCHLRKGIRFHDGAPLEGDDVVASFAVQWDAEHPLHAGNDGHFARMGSWFGGFLNPPASAP